MKLFLKKFAQVGGVVALALVLGIGVSVFATDYVGPGAFPNNAPIPLNVLETPQMKGYSADPGLTAILKLNGGLLVGKDSLNVAKDTNTGNLVIGAPGNRAANLGAGNIFGKLFINNYDDDKTSGIKIGGTALRTATDSLRAALDIDLTGRTGAGATDGVSVKSAAGAMTSAFITNSQVFHFYSDLVSRDARLWAGSIKLSEYSPAAGKVLTSGDSDGNGVWGTLKAGGGVPLTGNDVLVLGRYYDNDGSAKVHTAWAYCPSSYVAVSGGGDCEAGALMISQPIHSDFGNPGAYAGGPGWSDQSSSNPGGYTYVPGTDKVANYGRFPNGWQVKCSQGNNHDLHINVVCLKITPPTVTTTYPTPTAISAVGGGAGPSWKTMTGGVSGSIGQSCSDWLPTTGQAGTQGVRTWYGATNTTVANKCAYYRNYTGSGNDCTSFPSTESHAGYKPSAGCLSPGVGEIMTQTYR